MSRVRWPAVALLMLPLLAWAAPGLFTESGLSGWQAQTFDGKPQTAYRLVADEQGRQVLEARCAASASGLIWRESIDLAKTPILRWRWRTQALFSGQDPRSKAGDDFPLRVYAVREGGFAVWRTRAIVYVWSADRFGPRDWPSPYTGKAHMLALRSGAAGLSEWQEERRDLRADFRAFLGIDVTRIDGIALMSDCDNAGGRSRSWYGDLRLEAASLAP